MNSLQHYFCATISLGSYFFNESPGIIWEEDCNTVIDAPTASWFKIDEIKKR